MTEGVHSKAFADLLTGLGSWGRYGVRACCTEKGAARQTKKKTAGLLPAAARYAMVVAYGLIAMVTAVAWLEAGVPPVGVMVTMTGSTTGPITDTIAGIVALTW
jgi:hypothetical protein